MTCPQTFPLTLTPLTEPTQFASPTALPAGFDTEIAALLGNCCNLTYTQLANGVTTLPSDQIAALWPNNTFSQLAGFSVSEEVSKGLEIGTSGEYVTRPVGFVLTGTIPGRNAFNIIALRGTRTIVEWISDAEALPTPWHVGTNNGKFYPRVDPFALIMVHGGFYRFYNQGTNGTQPTEISEGLTHVAYSRPAGSIAAQVFDLLTGDSFDKSLPLYITGHSLGSALAELCAMDVGTNLPSSFPAGQLSVYSLAGPLVAAGLQAYGFGVTASKFVQAYGSVVPQSFRIVHSADIVPILPPSCVGIGSEIELEFAQVSNNAVNFCAQTGSIGGNHSCADTYVPYLQQLHGGFS